VVRMSKIYSNVLELVGSTPLLKLSNISNNVYAKLESFNPGGSVKDRIAKAMIMDALDEGRINKDSLIIEATSGNTGIGLALVCASLGMRLIIVMPDTMSVERRRLVSALGAEIVLTPGAQGMKGAIAKAHEIAKEHKNSFIASQFENESNARIHYETTGRELYEAMQDIDIFVAGVGTGGTITGVGRYLKEQNPEIEIIAVEPADSPVLAGGNPGPHGIQGIGAGFIAKILDTNIYDEIFAVETKDAYFASRNLAQHEGVLAGISSGAALHAALEIGKRPNNKDKKIVVLLPDTGERYLSTNLFE
jgi:cysteine synthase